MSSPSRRCKSSRTLARSRLMSAAFSRYCLSRHTRHRWWMRRQCTRQWSRCVSECELLYETSGSTKGMKRDNLLDPGASRISCSRSRTSSSSIWSMSARKSESSSMAIRSAKSAVFGSRASCSNSFTRLASRVREARATSSHWR